MSQELVVIAALPEIPKEWNYQVSVDGVKGFILNWKHLTIELASGLWIAREILRVKPKDRPRDATGVFVPVGKNWSSYCEEIGSDRHVINDWLRRFFPEIQAPKKQAPPKLEEPETCLSCEADASLITPRNVEAQCLLCDEKFCGGHISPHLSEAHGVEITLKTVYVDKNTGEIVGKE